MKIDDFIEKFVKYLPSITSPLYRLSFKEKLKWTFIVLVIYIFLSYVPVVGLKLTPQAEFFLKIQHFLGARIGSLLTLGIAPIVTAGIILQLLVGSKIINIDTTKPEGMKKFQTWNKFLATVFCIIEAIAYVTFGPLTTTSILLPFVIFQIAFGGFLVILMDSIVTKWGIGSGISLFIVAGVATQIFVRIFSPLPTTCSISNLSLCIPSSTNLPVGYFWQMIINFYTNNPINAFLAILPIVFTFSVLLFVVYIQGVSVDIPIAFSMFRGYGRTLGLKLLYTSVIPVIFAFALLTQLQLFSRVGLTNIGEKLCGPLGCFDANGNAISGFAYYISIPKNIVSLIAEGFNSKELLRIFTYSILLISLSTVFSVIWVETSGMNAKSIAEQIEKIGMQIPGYRRDPRVIESVLNKYIPSLSVLGGVFIGVLAVIGDLFGVVGGGTGLLLASMIIYNYYELIKNEELEGLPEFAKKLFGG
ncbi:MAG: preprotein translocase subunit SecY [Candidatus Aenigmatarchaeota archaeon]|jgi:preprotein translocase subunit SecY